MEKYNHPKYITTNNIVPSGMKIWVTLLGTLTRWALAKDKGMQKRYWENIIKTMSMGSFSEIIIIMSVLFFPHFKLNILL